MFVKKLIQKDANKRMFVFTLFAFFVFMMIFNLMHSDLWGDEWVEYHVSQRSILNGDLYKGIINTFQPPLYNFIMHFWLLISRELLWFRLFNVICGTVSGIAIYKSLTMLTNTKIASISFAVMGALYNWVYCVQECSEYTLMLMFSSLAIYLFIRNKIDFQIKRELLFVLCCVGAIYSQYGSAFTIIPLLAFDFLQIKEGGKKLKSIIIIYSSAFILFALPLFFFFFSKQVAHNSIVEHTAISVNIKDFINFFLYFGRVFGYWVNSYGNITINSFYSIIGIILLMGCAIVCFNKKTDKVKKMIYMSSFISYGLFYWLTIFHIYGMTHPGQSAGVFSRYSYFFMPLMIILILMGFYDIYTCIKKNQFILQRLYRAVTIMVALFVFVIPFPSLLANWNKANDRQLMQIWVSNGGFSDNTYMFGVNYGFGYYLEKQKCNVTGKIIQEYDIDTSNLPNSFWLYRMNWSGDGWAKTVDLAKNQGYQVVIYADYADAGQLAYCKRLKSDY